jgi:hypothetical protein
VRDGPKLVSLLALPGKQTRCFAEATPKISNDMPQLRSVVGLDELEPGIHKPTVKPANPGG